MDKSSINGRFIASINHIIASEKGVNKSILADKFGISPSKFSEILNKRMNVGVDLVAILCNEYDIINIEWLLTGQGDMLKQDHNTAQVPPKNIATEQKDTLPAATKCNDGEGIPLIPIEAMAGFNGFDNEGIRIEECKHYIVPEFRNAGCKFVIRVSGSSMYPRYSSGDILACRPIEEITFFQWGKIYVIDSQQGAMVKRIFEAPDTPDHILCVSDNDKYPPFKLHKSEIRQLALVVGAVHLE